MIARLRRWAEALRTEVLALWLAAQVVALAVQDVAGPRTALRCYFPAPYQYRPSWNRQDCR